MPTITPSDARWSRLQAAAYAVVVLLGAVLVVLTALNQPYNQNEGQQIGPYDDPDLSRAISGTRQPPLGPLLGVFVQRLLGIGHLEQRVVPMAAGIGCLVVTALLVRRLGTGWWGAVALVFMATAPVFLRFSAYTRPYALPMLLILVCALAGSRWLESGRWRWLLVAVLSGFGLPLARVPEPTAFLGAAAAVLVIAALRHRLPRRRAWLLAGGLLAGLVTVGTYSAVTLDQESQQTSTGEPLLDLDPGHALDRLPTGAREVWDYVLPLYGQWFPWWPVVVLAVAAALVIPRSRATLLHHWFWLPMVLAPLAFLVAFHTVMAFPLDIRHYRIRFAYFWVPPLTILVAVLLRSIWPGVAAGWWATVRRWVAPVLAAVLVLGQAPMTWRVLTENFAVDLELAGDVISDQVPAGSLVIYDGAALPDRWRQPFFGRERFLDGTARVVSAEQVARGAPIRGDGPVYLLILDSACASTVVCDGPVADWSGEVEGFEKVRRFDRFTLYEPASSQRGVGGIEQAMLSLVTAFGPEWSVTDAAAAARLMHRRGQSQAATELLGRTCDRLPTGLAGECVEELTDLGLGPLLPERG